MLQPLFSKKMFIVKNIFTLILLSLTLFKSSVIAQTNISCNAKFSWQYLNTNIIQFNPLLTGDTLTTHHYWLFGDGDSTNTVVPTHTYLTTDSFTVKHYVYKTNLNGTVECLDSSITVIQIFSCNIRPGFTWAADSTNAGKIIFTNQTTASTTDATAIWFFGDGTSGTGWNAFHEYSHPGKYYACLRVQTNSTCRSYHCDSVIAHSQEPECSEQSYFSFSNYLTNFKSYHFTPAFVNNSWQYTWTFGDGTGSHNIDPVHRYLHPGRYTVCLTVFRNENCASTTCKSLTASAQSNCDGIDITYAYQHDPIIVNRLYFSAPNNLIDQTWTFTKLPSTVSISPVILHQNNPIYLFPDTGYYRVCLKAVTTDRCIKEYCKVIYIQNIIAANSCILKTFPNPASTEVHVIIPLPQPELIDIYLYNSLNMLIEEKHQAGITGSNVIKLYVGNLVAGSYNIKIARRNHICYARFQKL